MNNFLIKHHIRLIAAVIVIGALAFGWMPDPATAMAGIAILGTAPAPFPITPELTAVAVAYKNGAMIADNVLPRVAVGSQAFKYNKYPIGELLSPPDTEVGRKGKPNEVEFTATETPDATIDQALDDTVPIADILNARSQPGLPDPEMRAALGVTELIVLRREVRSAALVFAAASYGADNKVLLAGNDQWSDYVNSSPLTAIIDKLDTMMMRPNIAVLGRATFTKIAQHPKVCKAVFGNNTDAGMVTRRQLADQLELEELYVGEGWVNTAAKGQAVVKARVWGKHAAFLHRNMNADPQYGVTFGFTAQWGTRFGGSEYDGNVGMRGAQRVRVGESVKELITANDLGFFFENAVA